MKEGDIIERTWVREDGSKCIRKYLIVLKNGRLYSDSYFGKPLPLVYSICGKISE